MVDCSLPEGVAVVPTWSIAAAILLLAASCFTTLAAFIGWLGARQHLSLQRKRFAADLRHNDQQRIRELFREMRGHD